MNIYLVTSTDDQSNAAYYALSGNSLTDALLEYEAIFDCDIDFDGGDSIQSVKFSDIPSGCEMHDDLQEEFSIWQQEQIGFAAHASLFDLEAV